MKFEEFIARSSSPERWQGVTKLPWGDPAFSERMLREHLSQSHDGASRRLAVVDRHVRWINDAVLQGQPRRILDLGCGPGLYTQKLAELGHTCVGIDIAPAAIDYARAHADGTDPLPRYVLGDMVTAEFSGRLDLVMFVHGELNVFARSEAEAILRRARVALDPGGQMLIEAHPAAAVEAIGRRPRAWMSVTSGLFGDGPHLRLDESRWDSETGRAVNLHWIVDATTFEVARFGTVTQAYTDAEYHGLVESAGFTALATLPSLAGDAGDSNYMVLLAST